MSGFVKLAACCRLPVIWFFTHFSSHGNPWWKNPRSKFVIQSYDSDTLPTRISVHDLANIQFHLSDSVKITVETPQRRPWGTVTCNIYYIHVRAVKYIWSIIVNLIIYHPFIPIKLNPINISICGAYHLYTCIFDWNFQSSHNITHCPEQLQSRHRG